MIHLPSFCLAYVAAVLMFKANYFLNNCNDV